MGNLEVMRIMLRLLVLTTLVIAFLMIGWRCRNECIGKRISVAFVYLSIQQEYTGSRSIVILTPEQEAEIRRRVQAEKIRLENEADRYKVLSILSFCAALIPLFVLAVFNRTALRKWRSG